MDGRGYGGRALMSRWSVFVSPKMPGYVRDDIASAFDATFNDGNDRLAPTEILKALEGKDALLTWISDKINAAFIAGLPDSVKAIGTYSVGYDHVDLAAAKAKGVAVFNTPDVLTDTVAECCMFLLLGVARRVRESTALMQNWTGWTPLQLNGLELAGKTIGIFGFGRVGRAIADRARGFRMKIAYADVNRLPAELEQGAAYHASPEDLLRNCDVLVLACNSTPETRGFLNRDRLALMKPTGIVVNISRGDIVDDGALIEALQQQRVMGAGLDVFNNEPNYDPRYKDLVKAFILPHIGSSTVEARRRMGQILVQGILALKDGASAPNRLA
jgi:lactate dehydrogenase-like 2-hydroxyacid dehydrogenase